MGGAKSLSFAECRSKLNHELQEQQFNLRGLFKITGRRQSDFKRERSPDRVKRSFQILSRKLFLG